jgi:hypothetical protein
MAAPQRLRPALYFGGLRYIWSMQTTRYFVVRLIQASDGKLAIERIEEKLSSMAAVTSARAYAQVGGGAIAFSRHGDLALDGTAPRHILAGFGSLPEDVEQFMRDV